MISAIQHTRKRLGLTQQQCADRYAELGGTTSARQYWSTWERKCPRVMLDPTFVRMCEVLETLPSEMMRLQERLENEQ